MKWVEIRGNKEEIENKNAAFVTGTRNQEPKVLLLTKFYELQEDDKLNHEIKSIKRRESEILTNTLPLPVTSPFPSLPAPK